MEILPLFFITAMVAYVLALGSLDLARTTIRVLTLFCAAFCLVAWGIACLRYEDWGRPVIDEFYATALIVRRLDPETAGLAFILGALVPVCFGLFEMWRLKVTRSAQLKENER